MKTIYLDNHATTPMDPRVLKAMLPYFKERYGNAASLTHDLGRQAGRAVEKARWRAARLIGADEREIIFTGGATESNNLALKGAAAAYREKGRHLVTVSTEHKSVLDPCKRLELDGFQVTYLPVKPDGLLDLKELEKAIRRDTILVSVMMANNETGVIQPMEAIGKLTRRKGILFHSDASQAVGLLPVDVKAMGIDLLSFSAHKIYGPKGVGALYVRKNEPRTLLLPLMDGGGHETGLRSGTLNVPGIVGFGLACELCRRERKKDAKRLQDLRDQLLSGLQKEISHVHVNGTLVFRLPNNLNISFEGLLAKDVLECTKGLALSTGSACLSSSPRPSHVLSAMGYNESRQFEAIRFGLGRFTTPKEIAATIRLLKISSKRLRSR